MKKHLVATLLAFTACADTSNDPFGPNPEFEEAASAVEGIYRVDAYLRNEAECAPGGESRLGNDTFAVAFLSQVFDHHILTIMSCSSIADCRAKVDSDLTPIEFTFGADVLGAGGELIGNGASSGYADGDVCTGGETLHTVVTVDGARLRLEQEITLAADYPIGANNSCSTLDAQHAAAGASCSQMEVLTATFVEDL